MKRVKDLPPYTFTTLSAYSDEGILVKCPKCGKPGIVTSDDESAKFTCTNCSYRETQERKNYTYSVHNFCESCERYYRVEIENKEDQNRKVLNVKCPHCGYKMQAPVLKDDKKYISYGEINDGIEPYFGFELWFLTHYKAKPIWAINRSHLNYLIEYVEADLREKPNYSHNFKKTQFGQLPTYIKSAKNRDGILKALNKLRGTD